MNIINIIKQTLTDPHFWGIIATGVVYVIGKYVPQIAAELDIIAAALGIVVIKGAATSALRAAK